MWTWGLISMVAGQPKYLWVSIDEKKNPILCKSLNYVLYEFQRIIMSNMSEDILYNNMLSILIVLFYESLDILLIKMSLDILYKNIVS